MTVGNTRDGGLKTRPENRDTREIEPTGVRLCCLPSILDASILLSSGNALDVMCEQVSAASNDIPSAHHRESLP